MKKAKRLRAASLGLTYGTLAFWLAALLTIPRPYLSVAFLWVGGLLFCLAIRLTSRAELVEQDEALLALASCKGPWRCSGCGVVLAAGSDPDGWRWATVRLEHCPGSPCVAIKGE